MTSLRQTEVWTLRIAINVDKLCKATRKCIPCVRAASAIKNNTIIFVVNIVPWFDFLLMLRALQEIIYSVVLIGRYMQRVNV